MKKYICLLKIADTNFKVVFNFGSLTFVTYLSHSLTHSLTITLSYLGFEIFQHDYEHSVARKSMVNCT